MSGKGICRSCISLKEKVNVLETELAALKLKYGLQGKCESEDGVISIDNVLDSEICKKKFYSKCKLSNEEIERYSRQLILPELSVAGQYKLIEATVLIVGAGGLGCPAATYLTAAGIGCIGIVDYDMVDSSNLHRQVLYTENSVGNKKVHSAIEQLQQLNSSVKFICHYLALSANNALDIIEKYDIVLDCTDNVATRYLLNDACVFLKKPLVSGSALRFEGQLTVYNFDNGPCYRCLYPIPPPPESVTNCSDGGVIGAVTGVIGSLQALEAIKIITGNKVSYGGKLLLYDGLSGIFRVVKLRGKQKDCSVCSDQTVIHELQDYEQFCGSQATDKEFKLDVLNENERISVNEYIAIDPNTHILIDVRSKQEFEICYINNSVNIPIDEVLAQTKPDALINILSGQKDIFFLCRRGKDSQKAVREILKYTSKHKLCNIYVKDIIGGLTAWNKHIDNSIPLY